MSRLWDRIDAQVRERIEDAVDAACLEILVESRRERGGAMPVKDSATDRAEFEAIVAAFLRHLREAVGASLEAQEATEVAAAEAQAPATANARPLAAQVVLAKHLPDYWSRFEEARKGFRMAFQSAPADREGWLGRLFGRRQP
jgi:hypothetical protein